MVFVLKTGISEKCRLIAGVPTSVRPRAPLPTTPKTPPPRIPSHHIFKYSSPLFSTTSKILHAKSLDPGPTLGSGPLRGPISFLEGRKQCQLIAFGPPTNSTPGSPLA